MGIAGSIKKITVGLISQDEMAIVLACETAREAQQLDFALDGYAIDWNNKLEDTVLLYIQSPQIGSHKFHLQGKNILNIDRANVLCTAYRLDNGLLDPISPRGLNRISSRGKIS